MTPASAAAPLARVVRSGLDESVHLGHVAVCDVEGRLLAAAGDPSRVVYLRSCAKPFQGAVSASVIGSDLPDRLLAVMCASHNGEPVHLRAVREVLRRGGLDASALRTPAGLPIDREAMLRARVPAPLLHNCSGKHAGMLLACVHAGWPIGTYTRASHPLQRRNGATIRRVSEAAASTGVDGCGVPVHALPLAAIATAYARLSSPDRFGPAAPWVARVMSAMRSEPYLVGGRERVDTAIMQATDSIVAKEGAEALACAVDLDAGIGIAVKVADGGDRAIGPALVAALGELGLVPSTARRHLAPLLRRPVLGGGRQVGVVEPLLRLRPVRRSRARPRAG